MDFCFLLSVCFVKLSTSCQNVKKAYDLVLNIYLVNVQDMMESDSCSYTVASLNGKKVCSASLMQLIANLDLLTLFLL